MSSPFLREKNIIDVVKFKWLWLGISMLFIIPGIVAMIYSTIIYPTHSPLRLGIDFTGGTMLQYGFKKQLSTSDVAIVRSDLSKLGIDNPIVQVEGVEKCPKNKFFPC